MLTRYPNKMMGKRKKCPVCDDRGLVVGTDGTIIVVSRRANNTFVIRDDRLRDSVLGLECFIRQSLMLADTQEARVMFAGGLWTITPIEHKDANDAPDGPGN